MEIKTFVFNLFSENTMVFSGEVPGRCLIADPGNLKPEEDSRILDYLEENGLVPEAILVTHAHSDHVCGIDRLQERYPDCPVYMHPADRDTFAYSREMFRLMGVRLPEFRFPSIDIREGDVIRAAGFEFAVIETPGHSLGCVCFHEKGKNFMLTGDTLFAGTIGRSDFKYGDYDREIRSIMEKLMVLDGSIVIYPGHGPSSTIGYERAHNPMLEPFNEPEPDPDEDLTPITITRK